ncbi:hypothetical protein GS682_09560 [Nostoc sp. B(2019)]|nr:hypothetical protein [Nostoc sp. B(2019)]
MWNQRNIKYGNSPIVDGNWYDDQGKRLPTPEERIKQAEQRAQKLAEKLCELGVDPDTLS